MTARVVLVTGAAGGVGLATLAAFRAQGWTVAGADRVIPPTGVEADRFDVLDLTAPGSVERLIEGVGRGFGRLDALVNNAAVQIAKPLVDTTEAEWDETMDANVRMAFRTMRAAYPILAVARGSVVNVSSVHAVATSRSIAAYAASKGALVALTRAAALEFAEHGVRVNAVLPGAVDTPMLRRSMEARIDMTVDEALADLAARTPLGAIGRPEEIAEAIVFLADSTRSSFITGQLLTADGGATARLSTE
jgi:NAD(P)-dependent dehydrogenase (short-subunit alcohol dehydrogenase family)